MVSRDGEPPRKLAVVEMTGDTPIRVDAPVVLIIIQPKRDGEPDRQTAAGRRDREQRKIVLTSPNAMDVAITQRYVGQIHARRHINVRALENGTLNEIRVRDGQAVKKGDLMFKIVPTFNKAKPDAVWANVIAPFDGIVDRQRQQLGSFIKEGEILTTLSDNSMMWVYFNVPGKQYLEHMANRNEYEDKIELVLANQTKFPQPGKIGTIEGELNNENGNIVFRADFLNPDGLLSHGQTGTILVHGKVHDAIVIPLRATYEIMNKRCVYVVDKDDVVHRREIVVQNGLDDIFVIKKGLDVDDRIVLEGVRQVRDGEKVEYEFRPLRWGRLRRTARVRDGEEVEYEFRPAEEVMRKLRNHAD